MEPTREQASQFVILLSAGLPASDAIRYFLGDEPDGGWTEAAIQRFLARWAAHPSVAAAQKRLMGKEWQELSAEERIKYALDKHYAEMAYFLFANNYGSIGGADKVKADTCRGVLETKLAGMAGKLDPLSNFLQDIMAGRVKLGEPGVAPQAVQTRKTDIDDWA